MIFIHIYIWYLDNKQETNILFKIDILLMKGIYVTQFALRIMYKLCEAQMNSTNK
jgi:hypothetical protein